MVHGIGAGRGVESLAARRIDTGSEFAGIDGGDNYKFAQNITSWLYVVRIIRTKRPFC
jgi:hypothetical protein